MIVYQWNKYLQWNHKAIIDVSWKCVTLIKSKRQVIDWETDNIQHYARDNLFQNLGIKIEIINIYMSNIFFLFYIQHTNSHLDQVDGLCYLLLGIKLKKLERHLDVML